MPDTYDSDGDLLNNGNRKGDQGSGPLSGDFGPIGSLSLGQLLGIPGLPGLGGCDFGVCGGIDPGNGFIAPGDEVAIATSPYIIRISVYAWPFIEGALEAGAADAVALGAVLPYVLMQTGDAVPHAKPQPQPNQTVHFEVCENVGETLDPQDPTLKLCHYVCPSGRVETRIQEAWRACQKSVVFGP